MNYEQSIEYITTKGSFGIKPGLERILLMLKKLGNPHEKTNFIHITGTNGKGSVTCMIENILQQAGLRTGKFISPHLEKWSERISSLGQDISEEQLALIISKIEPIASEVAKELEAPTQFEIITAAAFVYFAEQELDLVVLEVGMGGMLDSTNVVVPKCSIITNIGLEHTQFLGKTIEKIASEKAGIIKKDVPLITAAESVALNILIDKAAPLHAQTHIFRRDFTTISLSGNILGQSFLFRRGDFVATFKLKLAGHHQIINAALAVMAALILSQEYPQITTPIIQKGLENAFWPGRLELLQADPDIILDAAHNLDGAMVLRDALDKYYPGQDIYFIFGAMKDKNICGMIKELVRENDFLLAVPADNSDRAENPEKIAALSPNNSKVQTDILSAINEAVTCAKKNQVICIAGSLYLIGNVKKLLHEKTTF